MKDVPSRYFSERNENASGCFTVPELTRSFLEGGYRNGGLRNEKRHTKLQSVIYVTRFIAFTYLEGLLLNQKIKINTVWAFFLMVRLIVCTVIICERTSKEG